MTLILTVNGPETIWLLADRRLTANGKVVRDDARKILVLETGDGLALVGYAGLGATARGTEPSDWMNAVLRGRNLPLEHSLAVLAEAMKKELPRHIAPFPGQPMHSAIVTAFLEEEARLYTLDLVLSPDRRTLFSRRMKHVTPSGNRTPRIGLGGSGAAQAVKTRKNWMRDLLRVVRAADRRQVSQVAVADHLAKISYAVHQLENTVGPDCIVIWRNRKGGAHKGGGAHQCYKAVERDPQGIMLPSIAYGTDLSAVLAVLMSHSQTMFQAMKEGVQQPELDNDQVNRELAKLPETPDEKLR